MIKTIICPTDFSPAAQNGVQYAAKLARLTGARLYLVNMVELTPLEATVTALVGQSAGVARQGRETTAKLEELCLELGKLFGVDASFEVNAGAAPFHRVFSGVSHDNTLLVSGTNGEDDLLQRLFGSASYRIMKVWEGPLLVVPESVPYGTIGKLAYAWGEKFDRHPGLGILKDFVKLFNPAISCIHVTGYDELPGAEVYEELRRNFSQQLPANTDILYEHIQTDNLVESLMEYMRSSRSDLLAINHHHLGGSTAAVRKLIGQGQFPLLVIPS